MVCLAVVVFGSVLVLGGCAFCLCFFLRAGGVVGIVFCFVPFFLFLFVLPLFACHFVCCAHACSRVSLSFSCSFPFCFSSLLSLFLYFLVLVIVLVAVLIFFTLSFFRPYSCLVLHRWCLMRVP